MDDGIRIEFSVKSSKDGSAKIAVLSDREVQMLTTVAEGQNVVLSGEGPVWLYLAMGHALHGKARSLTYRTVDMGDIVIFDEDHQ